MRRTQTVHLRNNQLHSAVAARRVESLGDPTVVRDITKGLPLLGHMSINPAARRATAYRVVLDGVLHSRSLFDEGHVLPIVEYWWYKPGRAEQLSCHMTMFLETQAAFRGFNILMQQIWRQTGACWRAVVVPHWPEGSRTRPGRLQGTTRQTPI